MATCVIDGNGVYFQCEPNACHPFHGLSIWPEIRCPVCGGQVVTWWSTQDLSPTKYWWEVRECIACHAAESMEGDHEALRHAGAAVRQATEVLQDAGFFGPLEGEEEEELTDDEARCDECGGVIGMGGVEGTCADCLED